MSTQRQQNTWVHILVMLSLMLLPLQNLSATTMQHPTSAPEKCPHTQKHCPHADAHSPMQKNCDSGQDCCQAHTYGKYNPVALTLETHINRMPQDLPIKLLDKFSRNISSPELRPPIL